MKRTLNELLTEKCLILRNENRTGTANNYRTLKTYIEKHYGIVPMTSVTPQWAVGLHAKMKADGKAAATIKGYFSLLQSITNYAKYLGCSAKGDVKLTRTKAYELDKVKIEKPKTRQNKWLNVDEMTQLLEFWRTKARKAQKKSLGLFLASYMCNGCNLTDLLRLRYDDEYYNSKKQLFGFVRQKVKNTSGAYIRVPITPELREIINTIGDTEKYGGLVFGSFLNDVDTDNDEEINKRVMTVNNYVTKVVRAICIKLDMRQDVSITFARHSYCTNLNQAGVNYALIERNMGHSLGITDYYLGATSPEKLFEANSHLFKFTEQA